MSLSLNDPSLLRLDAAKPRSLLPIADAATDSPFKSRQNAGRAYPPAPARDRDHLLPANGGERLRFAGARAKRSCWYQVRPSVTTGSLEPRRHRWIYAWILALSIHCFRVGRFGQTWLGKCARALSRKIRGSRSEGHADLF